MGVSNSCEMCCPSGASKKRDVEAIYIAERDYGNEKEEYNGGDSSSSMCTTFHTNSGRPHDHYDSETAVGTTDLSRMSSPVSSQEEVPPLITTAISKEVEGIVVRDLKKRFISEKANKFIETFLQGAILGRVDPVTNTYKRVKVSLNSHKSMLIVDSIPYPFTHIINILTAPNKALRSVPNCCKMLQDSEVADLCPPTFLDTGDMYSSIELTPVSAFDKDCCCVIEYCEECDAFRASEALRTSEKERQGESEEELDQYDSLFFGLVFPNCMERRDFAFALGLLVRTWQLYGECTFDTKPSVVVKTPEHKDDNGIWEGTFMPPNTNQASEPEPESNNKSLEAPCNVANTKSEASSTISRCDEAHNPHSSKTSTRKASSRFPKNRKKTEVVNAAPSSEKDVTHSSSISKKQERKERKMLTKQQKHQEKIDKRTKKQTEKIL
eukprot:Platyproteum_vivax@DN1344_c0_g1_i1.p1